MNVFTYNNQLWIRLACLDFNYPCSVCIDDQYLCNFMFDTLTACLICTYCHFVLIFCKYIQQYTFITFMFDNLTLCVVNNIDS